MNFKKLSAAALAAGMALTVAPVFAAETTLSPDSYDKPQDAVEVATPTNKVNTVKVDKTTYEIKAEDADSDLVSDNEKTALEEIKNDADLRKDMLEAAGYDVKEVNTTVVIGSGFYGWQNQETGKFVDAPKTPFTATFDVDEKFANDFDGKNIYVFHYVDGKDGAGKWEIQTAKVEKGQIKVKMNSLSPVAFVGALGWNANGGTDGNLKVVDAPSVEKPNAIVTDNGEVKYDDNGKIVTTEGSVTNDVNGGANGGSTNGGSTNGGSTNGGSTNAGSTTVLGNKVSPNTAA